MQLVVVVSSFNLALTFNGHIFYSYCLLFNNNIEQRECRKETNHLNNRILLFVCNRKVIYYYYITLPSITITITITFGNFQSITITITGKSGYYNYILHITITPSLSQTNTLHPDDQILIHEQLDVIADQNRAKFCCLISEQVGLQSCLVDRIKKLFLRPYEHS